ncbi:hypothetical protein S83_052543 [Arachis hypogaea]
MKNNSDEAPANDSLWKEVENLKSNKNFLMQKLVKLKQHQEYVENKLLLLTYRLQGMEKHHQQLLSFFVMVAQSPGFKVQLLQPNKNIVGGNGSGDRCYGSGRGGRGEKIRGDSMVVERLAAGGGGGWEGERKEKERER